MKDKPIFVLALDDEENILNSFERLFFQEEFGIVTTSDYKKALEIVEKENIKIVLSDQRMPQITGVEFFKLVKDKRPDAIRILVTGYADITAAEDAINVGEVYRFINKPWNTEELKGAVRQAMNHYDLVIENRRLFEETKKKNAELEELNEKLTRMYETQKDFTSTVSHELRTPLASIKSTVDLVLSGSTGPLTENQEKFLTKTKSNVDRLGRLINDILDLTKLEAGKVEMKIEPNNLDEVVQEVVEIQNQAAKEKGLVLKTEIPSNLPKIPFDLDKMHQIMNNLMSNAIKFTKTGGITISCINHSEQNNVEVLIQDTGVGINKDDLDKVFKKFQQLGDSSQRVGGTGLGLAICKEIVQRHGGKIWADSEFGKGSCFHFVLPVEERRESL